MGFCFAHPRIELLREEEHLAGRGGRADRVARAQAKLTAFVGPPDDTEPLHAALKGCDLVTMTAGVARKPGMTRDDLFDINASIVTGARAPSRPLLRNAARYGALKGVRRGRPDQGDRGGLPDGVHQHHLQPGQLARADGQGDPRGGRRLQPEAADRRHDPRHRPRQHLRRPYAHAPTLLVLRDHLDEQFSVRKKCLSAQLVWIAEMKGTDPTETYVPVIGGHSGLTILPLLSQTTPTGLTFTDDEVDALSERIREVRTPASHPAGPVQLLLSRHCPERGRGVCWAGMPLVLPAHVSEPLSHLN